MLLSMLLLAALVIRQTGGSPVIVTDELPGSDDSAGHPCFPLPHDWTRGIVFSLLRQISSRLSVHGQREPGLHLDKDRLTLTGKEWYLFIGDGGP